MKPLAERKMDPVAQLGKKLGQKVGRLPEFGEHKTELRAALSSIELL